LAQALAKLGFNRKVLVIDHQENRNLRLAARNIAEVDLIPSLQVTPYQLLNAQHVVFSKAAIQALEEVLKK
jgi:large subunit ribosomal protein L4